MNTRRRLIHAAAAAGATAAFAPPGFAQPAPFDGVAAKIDADYPDIDSAVVLHRGVLRFEHHRRGDAQALYPVHSVTKSVLALLVGIAVERGAFNGLDQPVLPMFAPDDDGMRNDPAPITVRHLLTMTAGFESTPRWSRRDGDLARFLVARRRVTKAGERFEYDNLAYNLLALALEAAVKQPVPDFAREQFFGPLGIERFEWETGPNGHALGFAGLSMRTVDMARIGQLMLQQGRWQDRPVVPPAFVAAAVRAQTAGGPPVGMGYGYGWWIVPGPPQPIYLASGFGGQMVWVNTAAELVVATTARGTADSNARGQAVALLRNELVRAALSAPPR